MVKAQITTPEGVKISLEGTPAEVTAVVRDLKADAQGRGGEPGRRRKNPARVSPTGLVASLIEGGFFKSPRDLAGIRAVLEDRGHYYPVTTLSPAMLRLVRKRELRRIRKDKHWLYCS